MILNLLEEIKLGLSTVSSQTVLPIDSLPDKYEAWIIRIGQDFGVAVRVADELDIAERFAGARFRTSRINLQGDSANMLLLTSKNEHLRMEFSVICSQFVDPGEDGAGRRRLIQTPLEWWERWRSLLGNRVSNKYAHGLLGELVSYRKLLQSGERPVWTGSGGGVIDLSTPSSDYEIKSTISRYETRVSIAGQFQLGRSMDKALSLIFCRFEPAMTGVCINDLVASLVALGVGRSELEEELSGLGFEAGSSARSEKYRILEVRNYHVDEDFPGITLNSFVGGKMPEAVKQITYTMDLAGLPYTAWHD